jgi:hypothetical protein
MKKTFPLHIEGKHPDRVLDRVKHEVRKYLKRERARALPEGVDFWDFDCKFGLSEDTAQAVHLANVITCIDSAAKEQAAQVYVEIWAKHGVRTKRPAGVERELQERQSADAFDDGND